MALEYLTVEHISTKDLIRIFSQIEIHQDVVFNDTPCWIWCGNRTPKEGYGHVGYTISFKNTITPAVHRLMFAWLVHPLPKGKLHGELDHLCRRTSCCNPIHLDFVTVRVNVLRGLSNPCAINSRKTHCTRGHEFTPENTFMEKKENNRPLSRTCRECKRIRARNLNPELAYQRQVRYRLKKKATAADQMASTQEHIR